MQYKFWSWVAIVIYEVLSIYRSGDHCPEQEVRFSVIAKDCFVQCCFTKIDKSHCSFKVNVQSSSWENLSGKDLCLFFRCSVYGCKFTCGDDNIFLTLQFSSICKRVVQYHCYILTTKKSTYHGFLLFPNLFCLCGSTTLVGCVAIQIFKTQNTSISPRFTQVSLL